MAPSWMILVACCTCIVAMGYIVLRRHGASYRHKEYSHLPLPPGPKGLPLVGNLNDLPPPGMLEAHHWLKHKDLYGPISSITVMGQTMTIVNDARIAFELLEKRAAIHSTRPHQEFAGEMLGWKNALALAPYNNRFRTMRKNFARVIGTKKSAAQYNALQEAEAGHFLLNLLHSPESFMDHIKKEAGAIILKITYGYTAEAHGNDPLVEIVGDAMDKFAKTTVPGAFMVDIFPSLRRFPDWVPGTGFKRLARRWGPELLACAKRPYNFTRARMAQGDHSSFLAKLLDKEDSTAMPKAEGDVNMWTALSLFTGGADTTVISMECFFLAMSIFTAAQASAHEEIDRVIGCKRLPTAQDRVNLPYVEAVVKETLRWHPVVPMAIPHTSLQDDTFQGYRIPKGGMIMPNVWHFTHDPNVYHDPMVFEPSRFLGEHPEPDPTIYVFGFGRRICPGRILAENALFITIALTLAVFKITKAVDPISGKEVDPNVKFEPGVISRPASYGCRMVPRSDEHVVLIKAVEQKYPWQESDAQELKALKW